MMLERNILIGVAIGGVVLAGIVGAFSWLYAQNKQLQQELALTSQQLEQQRERQSEKPTATEGPDTQLAIRLDQLEASVQALAARLETVQDRTAGGSTQAADAPSLSAADTRSEPARFSDPYVESSRPPSNTPAQRAVTERGFAAASRRIAAEGEAPERAESVSQGLEDLSFSNPELTAGLSYDQPVCSESRCVVKGDVSQTRFSAAQLRNDADFEAEDAYYDFLRASQEQIDNAMGRKTQVSVYRSGDEIVMRIVPKGSQQSEGGIGRSE